MDRVLSNKKAILFFTLPALLWYAVIVLLPVFISFYYSLLDWDGVGKGVFVGLENYVTMFRDDDIFRQSLWNSIVLAILSVFVQLPISLVLALILAGYVKGNRFYRTVYFIPVVMSTVVIGQLWMKIYHPSFGLLNAFLERLGLESWQGEWLGSEKTALLAAFLPIVWQYIGYHMLLLFASAKSITEDLYEAARIDGATGVKSSIYITIPLIKPMLKLSTIFAVIGSLKTFDFIYVLTNGGPMHATEVPSTWMFSNIFKQYQYGYGSSLAIIIILECLLFTVMIQKMFKTD
ncbi:ABC transporter permease subunit [Paenibacillus sp. LMG 31458]|uniref:ABC transporter permease subunit n=1 Tax=Paenibacillus phytorum TaxID=2654977 RepID=A0ABX1XWZ0_9BACL|nr:sugar ABC transporter permease [Paenibacillus phytorum]NOU73078.1 ABC transporter permease subunit [Paenibacillus phytorum]